MVIVRVIDRLLRYFFKKILIFRHHIGFYLVDKKTISEIKDLPRLTYKEKRMIKKVWSNLSINEFDYTWSRIWKKEYGFSPYMLGSMWTWSILEKINPFNQVVSLENKALCDVYFPNIPFPKVYIRCIDGVLYNEKMDLISLSLACLLLKDIEEFIIKPSVDTLCGQGVLKISRDERNDQEYLNFISDSIAKSGSNFVIQELLKQHEDIASLNPTSINSCRVTTVYIDGLMSCSVVLKVGKMNSFKDNWNSSYIIGVDSVGCLKSFGYDFYLNKKRCADNGHVFEGVRLPCFEKMINATQQWHKLYFPQCGIVGWDVFIDSKNEVSVIEANLTRPGIVAEQLASGLFLQPYVDVICAKMKNINK